MSDYYQLAHGFANHTNQITFITGKAGTGKTTFLKKLKAESFKQIAVVAPTGIAAINAGGTTIHSFFQLPFSPFTPTPIGKKELISKMKMQGRRQQILRELELLVIDEISMVRADVLDAIDTVLRHYRHRVHQPFGGVQVVFIGDMFQLSPVAKREEQHILMSYYEGIHFFDSHVMQQVPMVYIELDKVFRQKNADFIHILDEVRMNKLSSQSLAKLESTYNPNFVPKDDDTYITLTTHNYKADLINSAELKKIDEKSQWFSAEVKGSFPTNNFPVDMDLELKKGAKVMFVKNDTEMPRRFYNGKIGEVTFIDDDYVMVTCPGEENAIYVEAVTWENMTYTVNKETTKLEEEITGSFTQIPLRHAWAITIHKSQGLTFDKAIIDAGDAFAPGQVYVALSRCRTLEGIVLKSKINSNSIRNEANILKFSSRRNEADELIKKLEASQVEYRKQLLIELFEFNPIQKLFNFLRSDVNKAGSSFNEETSPFLSNLNQLLDEIKEVANKFIIQLTQIFNNTPFDNALLQQRLSAASTYFDEKLDELLGQITDSPAYTDDKAFAKSYNEDLLNIYTQLAQKKQVITKLEQDFTIENYFKWRNSITIKPPKLQTHGGSKKESTVSANPELMQRLVEIRSELAEENNVALYMITPTKSLKQLADYLPQTPKEFLLIHGFGKVRVEKYGSFFLEEIRKYCKEKNLTSSMNELELSPAKERTTKPKQVKGATQRESLELYTDGKTIEEITQIRNLKESTIAGHLAKFLETGETKIEDFLSSTKREEALRLLKEKPNQPAYAILANMLTPIEYQFFLSWQRLQLKQEQE
ncbi:MAG TPA: HRDC domain-containing protein [Dysgonamonadaceae bacterium]|jgi:anion-transporting  ArsA/GET3 family ATPase|nr:HRDC domain-containing protein [Dysgonamonadaceae bacterium]